MVPITSGHFLFWIFLIAVVAPLISEIPLKFKMPVVVIEVLLGVLIGPHVLALANFNSFADYMFTISMAVTLFMAGMELDFDKVKCKPLILALTGWWCSIGVALLCLGLLHLSGIISLPLVVALALCTTGLGILIPIFRDTGELETPFGQMVLAAGILGEIAPIIAMSLLLSHHYSRWEELGFLLVFLMVIGFSVYIGINAKHPKIISLLQRHLHSSTQLPVRIAMLMLIGLFILAEDFGIESIFGAFAAGMIFGQTIKGSQNQPLRHKMDALAFGWFYPFFFIGTGIKFNVATIVQDATTALLVPAFALLFLIVRGGPVLLYRNVLDHSKKLSFMLASAVPSLSIIVVITEVGLRTHTIPSNVAAAMIGAALLAMLVFPTLANYLLGQSKPILLPH